MTYEGLLAEWMALTIGYPGWTLSEIQAFSKRERWNWLEVARQYGRIVRK